MNDTDGRLLLLDPRDNVLIARDRIACGETILIDGAPVAPAVDLRLGHKLARRAIGIGIGDARPEVWRAARKSPAS